MNSSIGLPPLAICFIMSFWALVGPCAGARELATQVGSATQVAGDAGSPTPALASEAGLPGTAGSPGALAGEPGSSCY